jgi:hypothetical protein
MLDEMIRVLAPLSVSAIAIAIVYACGTLYEHLTRPR